MRARELSAPDRSFWVIFLSIAIIGAITWVAIFEHNYHPRIDSQSDLAYTFPKVTLAAESSI